MEQLTENMLKYLAGFGQNFFEVFPATFDCSYACKCGANIYSQIITKTPEKVELKFIINRGDYIYTAEFYKGQNILDVEVEKEYFCEGITSKRKLYELFQDTNCGFLVTC